MAGTRSRNVRRTRSRRTGEEGFEITAVRRVPPELQQQLGGKRQLRRRIFVPLAVCSTRAAAERRRAELLIELDDRVMRARERQVSLGQYIWYYGQTRELSSRLRFVDRQIGTWVVDDDFGQKFEAWLDGQRRRGKLRRRLVDGHWHYYETAQRVSETWVRNIARDVRTVLRFACRIPDPAQRLMKCPFDKTTIGGNAIRRRPITEYEELWIMRVVDQGYPWLRPAIEFARTNPIRPQDQFRLRRSRHLTYDEDHDQWRICYEPLKTRGRLLSRILARPIVHDHIRYHFDDLNKRPDCDLLFARPGWPHAGEDQAKMYPIRVDRIWRTICRKAEAQARAACDDEARRQQIVFDVRWYDWRHAAVRFLKREGYDVFDIMDVAGWAGPDMVHKYDTRDDRSDITALQRARERRDQCRVANI